MLYSGEENAFPERKNGTFPFRIALYINKRLLPRQNMDGVIWRDAEKTVI